MKKLGSLLLALFLMIMLLPSPVLAAYSDTGSHWARDAIDRWSAQGVLLGNNGRFSPDDPITRGQLALILDRVMKYQTASVNVFSDLKATDYYYDAVLKANSAGVMQGSNNQVNGDARITRQDAAVMFARAFKLDFATGGITSFADDASIAAYAKGACQKMQSLGYLQGSNGKFDPLAPLTRAQAVTILDRMVKMMAAASGSVNENVTGNLLINTSNVTVGAVSVTGDVYVAPGVGSGAVSFNGTNITGRVFVMGGGINSVLFNNGARCQSVEAMRPDGASSIRTDASTTLSQVNIRTGSAEVWLGGNISTVSAAESTKITNQGSIGTLNLNSADVSLTNTGTLSNVAVSTKPKLFSNSGTIDRLTFTAGAEVVGNGTVKLAEVTGYGIEASFQTQPQQVNLSSNTTISFADMRYTNTSSGTASFYPTGSTAANAPPMITRVDVSNSYRTITITFQKEIRSNLSSSNSMRSAVSLSTNGTNYSYLGSSDSVSISGSVMTITLASPLSGTQSRLRIDSGALKDTNNNVQYLAMSTSALGGSSTTLNGLVATSFSPSSGGRASLTGPLTITFNKNIRKSSSNRYISFYRLSNGQKLFELHVNSSLITVSGSTATIEHTTAFIDGVEYYALIDSGMFESTSDSDVYAGITSDSTWRFTASNSGLTVSTYSPAQNATNIALNSSLVLTFNKSVRAINNRYIKLYTSGGSSVESFHVTDTSRVTISSNTVTIRPSSYLQSGTSYYVIIDSGAFEAVSDNEVYGGISSVATWAFTVTGGYFSFGTPSPNSFTVGTNTSILVTPQNVPSNATITVISSNTSIATVALASSASTNSAFYVTVTPVKAGTFTISMRINGTVVSTSNTYTVTSGTFSFGALSPSTFVAGGANSTIRVTPSNVPSGSTITVASSNGYASIVSYTASTSAPFDVTVKPVAAGSFTISVSVNNTVVSTSGSYTVTSGTSTISKPSDITMIAGESKTVTVTTANITGTLGVAITPTTGTPITYNIGTVNTSNNTSSLSINSTASATPTSYTVTLSSGTTSVSFTVTVTKPVITINTSPASTESPGASLTVAATVNNSATPAYQWYSNTTNSNTGGSLIGGATGTSYTVPSPLAVTTYYYCVVSSTGADSVTSSVTAVIVDTTPSITIQSTFSIPAGETISNKVSFTAANITTFDTPTVTTPASATGAFTVAVEGSGGSYVLTITSSSDATKGDYIVTLRSGTANATITITVQ